MFNQFTNPNPNSNPNSTSPGKHKQKPRQDSEATNQQYSYINRDVTAAKLSATIIVYPFSYYFPHCTWDAQFTGQWYSNIFGDSNEVNQFLISNLGLIYTNTVSLHELWVNSENGNGYTYRDHMKDTFINFIIFRCIYNYC